MKPKKPISQEERELFRQTVKDIKPLNYEPRANKPATANNLTATKLQQTPKLQLSKTSLEANPTVVTKEEHLEFSRSGIQQRTMHRLRQGRFAKNNILDLHQLTVAQSQAALENFIYECRRHNCRYAVIIHGKGYRSSSSTPTLKNKVNLWLREYADVLAFCTAKPNDGGAGAVYVLLKTAKTRKIVPTTKKR